MTDKAKYNIKDIIEMVDKLTHSRAPSLEQYKNMDDQFRSLKDAISVINEYKSRGTPWDPSKMVDDLLYLGAIHANMSEVVGYMQGMSSRAESIRKISTAQYSIAIKDARDDLFKNEEVFVKLTNDELGNASRIMASDEAENARSAETVSRIITSGWYAVADFMKVLETAIYRASREQNLDQ